MNDLYSIRLPFPSSLTGVGGKAFISLYVADNASNCSQRREKKSDFKQKSAFHPIFFRFRHETEECFLSLFFIETNNLSNGKGWWGMKRGQEKDWLETTEIVCVV